MLNHVDTKEQQRQLSQMIGLLTLLIAGAGNRPNMVQHEA